MRSGSSSPAGPSLTASTNQVAEQIERGANHGERERGIGYRGELLGRVGGGRLRRGASCARCWIGMRRTAHGCGEPAGVAGLLAEPGLLRVLSRPARADTPGGVFPQGIVAQRGAIRGGGVE